MKSGCIFSTIFALAALVIFAFIAPVLFQGADMRKVGMIMFWPISIIGGGIGYLAGRSRQK